MKLVSKSITWIIILLLMGLPFTTLIISGTINTRDSEGVLKNSSIPSNPPEGVLGKDPKGVDEIYDCGYSIRETPGDLGEYLGLVTITSQQHELFLDGPDMYTVYVNNGYVLSEDLQYQAIEMYRPFIVLESEPWYKHTLDLTEHDSVTASITYTMTLGIKLYGNVVEYEVGETTISTTESFSGWKETVENGNTKVIYFWCTFLRVFGSVTYNKGYGNSEIHDYDVFSLQSIDFNNLYSVEYDYGEVPLELPECMEEEFRDSNQNNEADPFYSLPSDGLYFGWSESKTYTKEYTLSGKLYGQVGSEWYNGIYLQASIKSVTSTTNTLTIKHTYTPDPDVPNPRGTYYDLFHFVFQNAYTMNIRPNWPPSVLITTPTNGQTVSGSIAILATANDASGITQVKLFINGVYKGNLLQRGGSWYKSLNTEYYPDKSWMTIKCKAYDSFGISSDHQISVYVRQSTSGGGGGCPILFSFDGEEYIQEGLLDIHDPEGEDIIAWRYLNTIPERVNNMFLLKLIEYPSTISHIDQVHLFGILPNGRCLPLLLISATHSELGQVKHILWFNDNNKVDLYGAEHTENDSEFINLKFFAPKRLVFIEFIFLIEGINYLVK